MESGLHHYIVSPLCVFFLFFNFNAGDALTCMNGLSMTDFIFPSSSSAGLTMECSSPSPVCITTTALALNDRGDAKEFTYTIQHCADKTTATRSSYRFAYHCVPPDQLKDVLDESTFSYCHCSDADLCTPKNYNISYPPARIHKDTIECFVGITGNETPYLIGGLEPCNGICVAYSAEKPPRFLTSHQFYACAPSDLWSKLGADSPDSAVNWNGIWASFCTTSQCNAPPIETPKPSSTLSCYNGFGVFFPSSPSVFDLPAQFFASVEQCQPGEICAAFAQYALEPDSYFDYYGCLNLQTCLTVALQLNMSSPVDWDLKAGYLFGDYCCTEDYCNYNRELMGSSTSKPVKDSKELQCFNGFQWQNNVILGEMRACEGVCGYFETEESRIWMCLDEKTCTGLNITVGECSTTNDVFDTACCYNEDTQPASSGCPLWGWRQSVSDPSKCYYDVKEKGSNIDGIRRCLQIDGRATLPTIRNAFENSEFAEAFSDHYLLMLGLVLSMNGTGHWPDGTAVTYANWASGQPRPGIGINAAYVNVSSRVWTSINNRVHDASWICEMAIQ